MYNVRDTYRYASEGCAETISSKFGDNLLNLSVVLICSYQNSSYLTYSIFLFLIFILFKEGSWREGMVGNIGFGCVKSKMYSGVTERIQNISSII